MKLNIPPKVLNLAEGSHLGTLTGRYGVYFKRDLSTNVTMMLLLSVTLGALSAICWFVSSAFGTPSDPSGDPSVFGARISVIVLMASFWFVFFYLSIVSPYLARETCVYLFGAGLIYQKKKKMNVVFWEQIKQVKISKDETDNNCSLLLINGSEIVFSHEIANLHDLAEEIKSHPSTSVSSLEKVIEGKRVRKKKVEKKVEDSL